MLLCDERFGLPFNINQLSLWIRPFVKVYSQFDEAKTKVSEFFQGISTAKIEANHQPTQIKLTSPRSTSSGHYHLLKGSSFENFLQPTRKFLFCFICRFRINCNS